VITQFQGMWAGRPVFVFGSGKSLDYLDPKFFDGQLCVTTNHVGQQWGLSDYIIVSHHYEVGDLYRGMGVSNTIVCPDRDTTDLESQRFPDGDNVFRFPASRQRFHNFSVERNWPADHDRLVVGSTGLHTAMHFAQYAGASAVILVGTDCGRLDGEINFVKYPLPDDTGYGGNTERSWLVWEQHNRQVANKLRSLGCPVYSLNPFINFGLEGHVFDATY
jgi:hypothetical protein